MGDDGGSTLGLRRRFWGDPEGTPVSDVGEVTRLRLPPSDLRADGPNNWKGDVKAKSVSGGQTLSSSGSVVSQSTSGTVPHQSTSGSDEVQEGVGDAAGTIGGGESGAETLGTASWSGETSNGETVEGDTRPCVIFASDGGTANCVSAVMTMMMGKDLGSVDEIQTKLRSRCVENERIEVFYQRHAIARGLCKRRQVTVDLTTQGRRDFCYNWETSDRKILQTELTADIGCVVIKETKSASRRAFSKK